VANRRSWIMRSMTLEGPTKLAILNAGGASMTNRIALSPGAMAVLDQAKNLSPEERIEIAARLWGDLIDAHASGATPDWHMDELDRRIREADENPDALIPAEDVYREIRAKLRKAK
jgi:putative addiction module component (TIGR02574 family)